MKFRTVKCLRIMFPSNFLRYILRLNDIDPGLFRSVVPVWMDLALFAVTNRGHYRYIQNISPWKLT